jgi:hypothetical protein
VRQEQGSRSLPAAKKLRAILLKSLQMLQLSQVSELAACASYRHRLSLTWSKSSSYRNARARSGRNPRQLDNLILNLKLRLRSGSRSKNRHTKQQPQSQPKNNRNGHKSFLEQLLCPGDDETLTRSVFGFSAHDEGGLFRTFPDIGSPFKTGFAEG